ncbi:MAG: phosphatidylinositol-3-phosphatase, partial [Microbacteriaceae bacterium]|nr:phosphatidylinositol-3-phosphatase [Microbacteriaceae bacterium]
MRRFGATLVLLALTLTGCAATTNPAVTASSAARPSPTVAAPVQVSPTSAGSAVTKVLVVVEENHTLAEMQAGMPYAFGLAQQYGYATHYTAIRH